MKLSTKKAFSEHVLGLNADSLIFLSPRHYYCPKSKTFITDMLCQDDTHAFIITTHTVKLSFPTCLLFDAVDGDKLSMKLCISTRQCVIRPALKRAIFTQRSAKCTAFVYMVRCLKLHNAVRCHNSMLPNILNVSIFYLLCAVSKILHQFMRKVLDFTSNFLMRILKSFLRHLIGHQTASNFTLVLASKNDLTLCSDRLNDCVICVIFPVNTQRRELFNALSCCTAPNMLCASYFVW